MKSIHKDVPLAALPSDVPSGAGRVLVGGELVYAAIGSMAQVPVDYVTQVPREMPANVWQRVIRNGQKVAISIHPVLASTPKLRVGIVLDGYLAWGRRKAKEPTVLIGGVASKDRIYLDVLVFSNGKLVEVTDRSLPTENDDEFSGAAHLMVQGLRDQYKDHQIVVAGPMGDLRVPDTVYIGAQPLKYVRYRSVSALKGKDTYLLRPLALVAASAVFYLGAIGIGWTRLSSATTDHQAVASSPEVVKHGGVDAAYVGVMKERRLFMQAPRNQEHLAAALVSVARGVSAVPGVKIQEMRLPGLKNGDSPAADVDLKVSVPKIGNTSLGQGQTLVGELARNTGLNWSSAGAAWREDGGRRIYTLEGKANGK